MAIYLGDGDTVAITTGGAVEVTDRHTPVRPEWTCAGCGEPYPCERGRVRLIAAHGGYTEALAMRGVELMEQAIVDGMPYEELFGRFIAWTAPPTVEVPR